MKFSLAATYVYGRWFIDTLIGQFIAWSLSDMPCYFLLYRQAPTMNPGVSNVVDKGTASVLRAAGLSNACA